MTPTFSAPCSPRLTSISCSEVTRSPVVGALTDEEEDPIVLSSTWTNAPPSPDPSPSLSPDPSSPFSAALDEKSKRRRVHSVIVRECSDDCGGAQSGRGRALTTQLRPRFDQDLAVNHHLAAVCLRRPSKPGHSEWSVAAASAMQPSDPPPPGGTRANAVCQGDGPLAFDPFNSSEIHVGVFSFVCSARQEHNVF